MFRINGVRHRSLEITPVGCALVALIAVVLIILIATVWS